jgi:hypothetical protein
MDILILKTDINSKDGFLTVKNNLLDSYNLNDCTIDLEDEDKVLRVIGDNLNLYEVTSRIINLGFVCEELPD